MKHDPLTRQRSEWSELVDPILPGAAGYVRRVHDGQLMALVADEPTGWHMSISFLNHRREATRYPTWDEQFHAVRTLLPADRTYAMFITPDDEYVALHRSTFHWHEATQ